MGSKQISGFYEDDDLQDMRASGQTQLAAGHPSGQLLAAVHDGPGYGVWDVP